jgi:hypothetical protein
VNNKVNDLYNILRKYRLNPSGPDASARVKRKTMRHATRTNRLIGGLLLATFTTWTISYDQDTRRVIEAKREFSVGDIVKKATELTSTVVFLTTTGGATWPKDSSWNNLNNTVECIGAGGQGGSEHAVGKIAVAGAGAGGGAYALKANVTLAGNPSYTIGAQNSLTATNFNTGSCIAAAGQTGGSVNNPATGGAGGTVAASTGDTRFAGGNGGNSSTSQTGGGGGGGAAGLHGAGGNGGVGTASPGAGGTGDNGNTAAGTNGTQWDSTHGSGGGANGNAGVAGFYGAGGGGASAVGSAGSAGTQGLIVLTWTPVLTGVKIYFMG